MKLRMGLPPLAYILVFLAAFTGGALGQYLSTRYYCDIAAWVER